MRNPWRRHRAQPPQRLRTGRLSVPHGWQGRVPPGRQGDAGFPRGTHAGIGRRPGESRCGRAAPGQPAGARACGAHPRRSRC
ncbi:hypothetical protein [Janthinobacterium sp. UMAB-60]|uniref:PPE family protein, SVP subgroup n=1 Tax=Janthinobacterium sp. UMAB-60 TaxID=1365365 RepID=UPI0035AB9F24